FKDHVAEIYFNELGNSVYVISREKSLDRQHWVPEKNYTYRISEKALLRNMDNQTTIPFVFPPKDGRQWDGNAYNSASDDEFQMVYHPAYSLGERDYGAALQVVQNEEDDFITARDKRFEVFVKHI